MIDLNEEAKQLNHNQRVKLVELVRKFSHGYEVVDGREYRKVKDFARRIGLLEREGYRLREQFHPTQDLPPECLWWIFKPVIGEGIGYSLNQHKIWQDVNLLYGGHDCDVPRWQREREMTLIKLDQWGYIWFQAAGNIWSVTPRVDR